MKFLKENKYAVLFALAAMAALLWTAKSSKIFAPSEGESGEDHDARAGERVVKIEKGLMEELGIKTATAGPGLLRKELSLNGEVAFDPDRVAHVSARFAGVAREIRKKPGDRAGKDETLAVVESNESLRRYEIKSPISGSVIFRDITLGESVREEKLMFTIADTAEVWVIFSIYQKDLRDIRPGQPVTVITAEGGAKSSSTISYISSTVDERTRTASARTALANPSDIWKPGLFVEGKVLLDELKVPLMIPRSALQTVSGKAVVFVKTSEGFRMQSVGIGEENADHLEIRSGLADGDEVATEGSFYLKSEVLKEQIGEDEGEEEK